MPVRVRPVFAGCAAAYAAAARNTIVAIEHTMQGAMALALVRRMFVFICMLGVAGCGSQSNPVAPSVPLLAGKWVGSLDPGAVPLNDPNDLVLENREDVFSR